MDDDGDSDNNSNGNGNGSGSGNKEVGNIVFTEPKKKLKTKN
jgi:hypothetical protein